MINRTSWANEAGAKVCACDHTSFQGWPGQCLYVINMLDTAEANINDLDTDLDQSCRHFFQILINLTVNTEWWINRINVCLKPMISNLFLLTDF